MGYPITKGATAIPLRVLLIQSSDHITGASGISVATVKSNCTVAKSGATSFTAAAGTFVEVGNGFYDYTPTSGEVNTAGPFSIFIFISGTTDPFGETYNMTGPDTYDAQRFGLASLPNANPAASGGIITFGTGAGQINPDGSGNLTINDAFMDIATGIEAAGSHLSLRGAIRVMAAALAGQLAGAPGTSITIAAANSSGKTRITATVDSNGNRTSVTLDPTT